MFTPGPERLGEPCGVGVEGGGDKGLGFGGNPTSPSFKSMITLCDPRQGTFLL